MNPLTPEKALEQLDGIAAKYQGTREDHKILSACSSVLQDVIQKWRASEKRIRNLEEKILEFEQEEEEIHTLKNTILNLKTREDNIRVVDQEPEGLEDEEQ